MKDLRVFFKDESIQEIKDIEHNKDTKFYEDRFTVVKETPLGTMAWTFFTDDIKYIEWWFPHSLQGSVNDG